MFRFIFHHKFIIFQIFTRKRFATIQIKYTAINSISFHNFAFYNILHPLFSVHKGFLFRVNDTFGMRYLSNFFNFACSFRFASTLAILIDMIWGYIIQYSLVLGMRFRAFQQYSILLLTTHLRIFSPHWLSK